MIRVLFSMSVVPLVTAFFFLVPASHVSAKEGFTFVKSKIAVTAKPDDKKVTVPYHFVNNTKRILTIAKYDSACSCLSAKVRGSKLVYQPGEKGEIRVDFAIGAFSGTVEKTVLLWTTDDPDEKPSTVMTVELTIPMLVQVTPTTLFWDQGADSKPQTIKIKVNHDKPIHITEHDGSNKNFPYELKTIRKGWEYEIIVKPGSTEVPGFGMIRMRTDSPIPRYQRQQAFVCVRRPKK